MDFRAVEEVGEGSLLQREQLPKGKGGEAEKGMEGVL